ncbi:MAG: RnfH family protein [Pseudomonadota bacterium]
MKVGIAYALPHRQVWFDINLPEGSTVREAIERSGIRKQFPEIDLEKQKVGIYNKVAKLDAVLQDGDRVEIYRPITCDPVNVPRRARSDSTEAEG